MEFEKHQIFHIYNQGNNGRKVFLDDENYIYFLWKMKTHLLTFGDLISYCLMPNHFHWQFLVKELSINKLEYKTHVNLIEFQRKLTKYGKNAFEPKQIGNSELLKQQDITLNQAIGILLSSYSKALNRQYGMNGSIFRQKSKAKSGLISHSNTNNSKNPIPKLGSDYQSKLIDYIHKNPEVAGIVKNATDWPFSSAKDYAGLRKDSICNLALGKKIMAEV